mmetsp:Transcript_11768/g.47490  ORF Transcript_11768/g.47490 Transcript_11768/m.47490 type:complete len:356 (-) Transcript_11768:215-1282(-)
MVVVVVAHSPSSLIAVVEDGTALERTTDPPNYLYPKIHRLSVELDGLVLVGVEDVLSRSEFALLAVLAVDVEHRGELGHFLVGHVVRRVRAVLAREGPARDLALKRAEPAHRGVADVGEDFAELRDEALVVRVIDGPEQVGVHQDLTIRVRPRADADDRNLDALRQRPSDDRGNALGDDAEGPRVLQRHGVVEDLARLDGRPTLRSEAAQRRDRLRRQTHVAHRRDAAVVYQFRDGRRDAPAALDLDGVGAALLDDAHRRPQSVLGGFLVRPKRQIAHQERRPRTVRRREPAPHGLAVVDHLVQRHRLRRRVAELDHAERVADEGDVHARAVDVDRRRVVEARHHRDALAAPLGA